VSELFDGKHIEDDLRALNTGLADLVEAFLDHINETDQALTTLMRRDDAFSYPAFTVKALNCFLNRGYNVSRIRPLIPKLNELRILFALDNRTDDFYLLAIVKKCPEGQSGTTGGCYDYNPEHTISKRVFKEYDELRLPILNA
jgi:hypothetical protein